MKKGTNAKGVHIHSMDSVKMEFVYCLTKIKKKRPSLNVLDLQLISYEKCIKDSV